MRFPAALVIVTVSGFIALSYEIVWFRAFAFVTASSPATFGTLLGLYLLGLALGALTSRRWCQDGNVAEIPKKLRTLAMFVLLANAAGYMVVPALAWLATLGFWGLSYLLVTISAGMLGAVLPLVSHAAVAPDDRAGSGLSFLYLANIIGSAAGSLLTGCVIMDLLGLADIQLALLLLGLAGAAALALAATRRVTSAGVWTPAAAALIAVLLHGALHDGLFERLQLKTGHEPGTRFADVLENRHGVITVTRDGRIFGGGSFDGAFSTDPVNDTNWIRRAYVLSALKPSAGEVLMVGLSSGSWAQVVAHLPGLEKLTIIEINPGYLPLIAARPQVSSLLQNPSVEIVIDDARRWISRHPDLRFDMIIQNTTQHWRAHCTNLLSSEYLDACRRHLRPGGIFYFNTTFSRDAMRTAAELYPHAHRVFNFMAVSDDPLTFDPKLLERAMRAFRIDGRPVLEAGVPDHEACLQRMLALEKSLAAPPVTEGLESRASLLARLTDARLITDDNMICEWRWLPWWR